MLRCVCILHVVPSRHLACQISHCKHHELHCNSTILIHYFLFRSLQEGEQQNLLCMKAGKWQGFTARAKQTKHAHLNIHDGLKDDRFGFVVSISESIEAGKLEGQLAGVHCMGCPICDCNSDALQAPDAQLSSKQLRPCMYGRRPYLSSRAVMYFDVWSWTPFQMGNISYRKQCLAKLSGLDQDLDDESGG